MRSTTILFCFYALFQIAPTNQRIVEDDSNNLTTDGDPSNLQKHDNKFTKTVTYHRASTPIRILECITKFSILRCSKLFVLQRMEERQNYPRTGNLTKDFLDQFLGGDEDELGMESLIKGKIAEMPDGELTQRVIWNFQKFFQNRDIQLHFLPGVKVQIVPSKENKIKLSLKRNKRRNLQDLVVSGRSKQDRKKGKRKNKKSKSSYKDLMIQMAVPVMVMPAVLLGTFLPFILPAIKMATFMTTIMNNSALLAALLYAARTHVMNSDNNEAQPVMYSPHGGFH